MVTQNGRPNRKVFKITTQGRDELLQWLRGPHASERHNSLTTLKAFNLHLLPKEEAIAKVEELAAEGRRELERYREKEKMLAAMAEHDRAFLGDYLALLFGLNYSEAYQRWCDQARALLSKAGAKEEPACRKTRRKK